ncbi:hypothetical protein ASPFODRAFT_28122 [Aspergillus luchuensis CBS 106.47]|uniref:HIT domain-containing protein n=1 Tax=Aspergillus luchuensis (strain CBS 106.47) TaxID=1137211 RepID=A0A1M3U043_ASPLC|nr:hypothetical protein ASPFODRAFT_28122 [Aspergillus luchuensis CBS 106.47]
MISDHHHTCPFCAIAHKYPPLPPTTFLRLKNSSHDDHLNLAAAAAAAPTTTITTDIPSPDSFTEPSNSDGPGHAHLLLSTKHVLAFLDIMPLTRGHVLVATREHCERLGDVGVAVGKELCKVWIGLGLSGYGSVLNTSIYYGTDGWNDTDRPMAPRYLEGRDADPLRRGRARGL